VENLRLRELYQCFAAPAMKAKGSTVARMLIRRAYRAMIASSWGDRRREKLIPLLREISREI
jgi:hypothetical protein